MPWFEEPQLEYIHINLDLPDLFSMRKTILYILVWALFSSCSSVEEVRITECFNQQWRFSLEADSTAIVPTFDDSHWRELDLPHDWSIESDFGVDYPASPGSGALPGGTGWYRKTFDMPKSAQGKRVYVAFDGIYWCSTVYLNGHKLGFRPNGFISFEYELTPYLHFGGENVIVVKVDNSQQPNSRWYTGSGIYRNVWLKILDAVHVAQWGTYITTSEVSEHSAKVNTVTTVINKNNTAETIELITQLYDAEGSLVASNTVEAVIPGNESVDLTQLLPVENPNLWSDLSPYLYHLNTHIRVAGKLVDNYTTTVGIRSFEFDAQAGFILNGKPTKIRGVCMHHDLGCLGAAVNVRALERQLQLLKEMGCNGIRTSHNPPTPELLDLCDKMGFIVQDEIFDIWRKKKSPFDYSRFFPEWHERDLTDFVLRDRNHPSIFMWSIGNEVLEQWSHIDADTLNLQQANMILNFANTLKKPAAESGEVHVNTLLTIKLADIVRKLDATRPITTGNNETEPENYVFRSGAMDIIGFNYHTYNWGSVYPKKFPNQPLIITESTSALMSRGYYMSPSDSAYIWPVRWDLPFHKPIQHCSSYDNCHVPWGTTHEESWNLVKKHDYISGFYIWTGFDYLGEPTPFWWPSRSSYFGIIDLAGFPKDIYYMYQSEWTSQDVLHLFPHWNWSQGEMVDMWAYYNHADSVELFVNGISKGVRQKEGDQLHVMWRIPFERGTVEIKAYGGGKEVRTSQIKTAGPPALIRLKADRDDILANGVDLSFVTIEVLDNEGNVVPVADNLITFYVEGEGSLVGTDNGDPTDITSLKRTERHLFNGKCLAVVQSASKKGTIRLKASSPNLPDAMLEIRVK